jgi:hypothetical protein
VCSSRTARLAASGHPHVEPFAVRIAPGAAVDAVGIGRLDHQHDLPVVAEQPNHRQLGAGRLAAGGGGDAADQVAPVGDRAAGYRLLVRFRSRGDGRRVALRGVGVQPDGGTVTDGQGQTVGLAVEGGRWRPGRPSRPV